MFWKKQTQNTKPKTKKKKKKKAAKVEEQGIDPCAFCMQSRRSTIWATPPHNYFVFKKSTSGEDRTHANKVDQNLSLAP